MLGHRGLSCSAYLLQHQSQQVYPTLRGDVRGNMSVLEGNSTSVRYEWLVYLVDKPNVPMIDSDTAADADTAKGAAAAVLEKHADALAVIKAVAAECHAHHVHIRQSSQWNGETSLIGVCVKGGVKWMAGTKLRDAMMLLRVRRALRQL